MNGRGVICERWQVLQRGAREAYASGAGAIYRRRGVAL